MGTKLSDLHCVKVLTLRAFAKGVEGMRKDRVNEFDRFRYRTRYFADSGIIGSREFVDRIYQQFNTTSPQSGKNGPNQ